MWAERNLTTNTNTIWEFVPTVNLDSPAEERFNGSPAVSFYGETPATIMAAFSYYGGEVGTPLYTFRIRYQPKSAFSIEHPETFFYPLDAIRHWNRVYGRRGFTQYQCVIPDTAGPEGVKSFVELLRRTGGSSMVSVIKDCGDEGEGMLSFPMRGTTVAADFPAREKVKVYTIFAGRYAYRPDFLGRPGYSDREIDTSELQEIAKRTGGRFFRARDRTELEAAYGEIEKLERTQRITRRWSETFDLYPWFLGPGLALYVLSWLASASWLRRAP